MGAVNSRECELQNETEIYAINWLDELRTLWCKLYDIKQKLKEKKD
jgi:hypothetical protein